MKKERSGLARMVVLAVLAGGVTGCGFLANTPGDPLTLASIATVAWDVHAQLQLQSTGALERSDLLETDPPVSSGHAPATVTTDSSTRTLPDGTLVTIVVEIDDRNTPEPEDDILTVTRTHDSWGGAEKAERIVRPRRPESTWGTWVDDLLVQQGTIVATLGGVTVQQGTITATWERLGDEELLVEVDRRLWGVGPDTALVRTVITSDGEGETRTRYRIRVIDGDEVVVATLVFETFIDDDGIERTRILRDDGSFALIVSPRDPRIIEHYDPAGILRVITTETWDRPSGVRFITRDHYDADGTLVATVHGEITIRTDDGVLLVERRFDRGREVTATVTELVDGYLIDRDGFVYRVAFVVDGLEIFDDAGLLIARITFAEDGSVMDSYPDGQSADVDP